MVAVGKRGNGFPVFSEFRGHYNENRLGIKEIRRFVPGLETGIFRRFTVPGYGGSGAWKEVEGKNHLDDLC